MSWLWRTVLWCVKTEASAVSDQPEVKNRDVVIWVVWAKDRVNVEYTHKGQFG